MLEVGISVYPDFYSVDKIKVYLKSASELGFKKVFVSLILNNLGFENSKNPDKKSWSEVFRYCAELGLEVSADINDEVFRQFECSLTNLNPLSEMGITKLRIDGGFKNEEIATITNNKNSIKVEVNASLSSGCNMGEKALEEMRQLLETVKKDGNIENLTACHNFFPLPETALSLEDIKPINRVFKEFGVRVGGFVASQLSPKDLHHYGHGVCTIEEHRYLPAHIAMIELFANGFDYVLIGDSMAENSELQDISRCASQEFIEIPVIFNKYIDEGIKEQLIERTLVSRVDQPEKLIRATDTRGIMVMPCYCAPRDIYTISINNKNSAQYMGEIQIALQDMGSSIEHNVIGFVHPFGKGLLEYVKSGRSKFRLVEY